MKADRTPNLIVRLSGRPVGVLTRLGGDTHVFAFDQAYLDDPARPTLSLSFKSEAGGIVTVLRPYGVRVPPFYSNLLPEGHLRHYLAVRAGVKPEREFFLLAALRRYPAACSGDARTLASRLQRAASALQPRVTHSCLPK